MSKTADDTKRKGLMERVLELFFREGVSSQTMEGIADNIGISKRTLYKYFTGKDLLIDTVIQFQLESIEANVLALQSSGKPYLERLIGFFTIVEKAIKPMANKLITDILKNAPWIWPKIDEFRHNRILIHLEALLAEGSDLGYLRGDLNLKVISPIYIAIIEQIGRPEFIVKQAVAADEIVATMIKVLLGGILSDEGRNFFEAARKELSHYE
ncbi:MAG: TetR/AcrR family transcriptional regulator [Rectinemataceae bacterium]|jgi:AcrR family transcriptional regulator